MSIKKYVKALVETSTKEHLENIYSNLEMVHSLANNDKYKLIISSPMLENAKKVEFLTNTLTIQDDKTINLLKLLAVKNRLVELPKLVALLKDTIAELTGNYKGFVYSKENLNESKLLEIETKLSNRFKKNIKLEQKISNKDGIQVYVDSLNVEIAIYEDDIKSNLIKNIIRAI